MTEKMVKRLTDFEWIDNFLGGMHRRSQKENHFLIQNRIDASFGEGRRSRDGEVDELKDKWHKAGWEDGVREERRRLRGLVENCNKLIDSIKWSGDINEVNIAPKIGPIRDAINKYHATKDGGMK